jgi:electron transfer flavoprotein alpha subunit
MQESVRSRKDISGYSGFWVIGESEGKKLRKVTLELLSEAKKLADKRNQKVTAVLVVEELLDEWRQSIAQTGCDEILQIRLGKAKGYSTDLHTQAVVEAVRKRKPETVLFAATENGRDLAPRVACRLQNGLTADCTRLEIDENGNLVQIRPTYGGNIMASIIAPYHRPQMASVRPNVMQIIEAKRNSELRCTQMDIRPDENADRVALLSRIEKELNFKDVCESEVIVAGGYGLGSKENFKWIHKLSSKLNAAAGATRKVVDEGWAPLEIQIGQTGKTVAPDLYIACGISGALQHSIGIKNAKKVIAINNDPAAPIFSMCDIAVLGDAVSVLKALYERIKD